MGDESAGSADGVEQHEVIIIGAGVCGIYMLHRMLAAGVDATVLEAGEGPGGTWYWNRYPGARFDSESYSYGYSFDEEILEEWNWTEHFAAQPETLRYLNFVVDKLNLRNHMQFGCKVVSAAFDESASGWDILLEDGRRLRATFLITAIGMLSAATLPRIEGVERFEGLSFHTYYWPQEPVELEGKRVAVIGTGATGVQVIAEIADKVADLTVYQRRPNWCAPLNNSTISPEEMAEIRSRYDEIFQKISETPGSFLHGPDYRAFDEVSEEERHEGLMECLQTFTRIWHERKGREPSFDLISLLQRDPNTRDMVERPMEYLGNLMLLIVGGNDTTRNSATGGVLALNQNPVEYDKLRANPGLIPGMVSEIIRWQTPLAHMRRTATCDTEFKGKKIRKGDKVVLWYLSANRDESVIENPDQFIIDRKNPRHHIAFGFGVHRCMGNRLAEMQLRILWEEIMQRFRMVEVMGEPERVVSNFVRGYKSLPVRLHAL